MRQFRAGEIELLVCTTVVEVGVDVPNATLLVVEHAERFGLSQLHQLRGRVSRGPVRRRVLAVRGTGQRGGEKALTGVRAAARRLRPGGGGRAAARRGRVLRHPAARPGRAAVRRPDRRRRPAGPGAARRPGAGDGGRGVATAGTRPAAGGGAGGATARRWSWRRWASGRTWVSRDAPAERLDLPALRWRVAANWRNFAPGSSPAPSPAAVADRRGLLPAAGPAARPRIGFGRPGGPGTPWRRPASGPRRSCACPAG